MPLAFLLDADTERDLADHLARDGHDVERVVEVLERDSSDAEVMVYALASNRIIVTHDKDFADPALASDPGHAGVFYAPNQRLSSFDLYRIISNVIDAHPGRDSFPSVVFLTEDWL